MFLRTTSVAVTYLAEGLNLKQWYAFNIEQSVINFVGVRQGKFVPVLN
jgi:hypothetical protein